MCVRVCLYLSPAGDYGAKPPPQSTTDRAFVLQAAARCFQQGLQSQAANTTAAALLARLQQARAQGDSIAAALVMNELQQLAPGSDVRTCLAAIQT